jgi:hypothetical protein
MGFRVLQMFSNNQYGDIAALGPKGMTVRTSTHKMIWLGRLTFVGFQSGYLG